MRPRLDPAAILEDLRRVFHAQGALTVHVYREHGRFCEASVRKYFETFINAARLAGLPTKQMRTWSAAKGVAMEEGLVEPPAVPRWCLKCDRRFFSRGNRICDRCHSSKDWTDGPIAPLGQEVRW
jgi:hypothetical protein